MSKHEFEVMVDVTISGSIFVKAASAEEAERMVLDSIRSDVRYETRNFHYLSSEVFETIPLDEED